MPDAALVHRALSADYLPRHDLCLRIQRQCRYPAGHGRLQEPPMICRSQSSPHRARSVVRRRTEMGTAGAALATVIAQMVAFAIGVAYQKHALVQIHQGRRHGLEDSKRCDQTGIPAGLGNMYSSARCSCKIWSTVTVRRSWLAFAAASKIDAFAFLPMLTLGVAIMTMSVRTSVPLKSTGHDA